MAQNIAKGGRDNYPTPQIYADWAIDRALKLSNGYGPLVGLEPGCGKTAPFMRALSARSPGLFIGVEKEKWFPDTSECSGTVAFQMGADFLSEADTSLWRASPSQTFDIIATNPPFSQCEAFMAKSIDMLSPSGVMVFLLRMAIMGSKKRLPFWKDHMPIEIAHFVRRISFDGTSTDYAEYACFFWVGTELAKFLNRKTTAFYLVDNVKKNIKDGVSLMTVGAP